jgi:protein involved in polysaccharide export with SLBB domain
MVFGLILACDGWSYSQGTQGNPPVTQPDQKSQADGSGTKPPPTDPQHPGHQAPPPANPLVLVNPMDGSGNATDRFDKDGNRKRVRPKSQELDYRGDGSDIRVKKPSKPLPLYGYSFFLPARRLILAHSARLLRDYEGGTQPAGRNNGTSRAGTGRSGGTRGQGQHPGDQNSPDRIATPFDRENGTDQTGQTQKKKPVSKPDQDDPSPYNASGVKRAPGSTTGAADQNGTQTDNGTDNANGTGARNGDNNDDSADALAARRAARTRRAQAGDTDEPDQDLTGDSQDSQDTAAGSAAAVLRRSQGLSSANDNTDLTGDEADMATLTASERLVRERRMRNNADLGQGEGYDSQNGAYANGQRRRTVNGTSQNAYPLDSPNNPNAGYERFSQYEPDREPIDASTTLADPLTQLYRNVIATAPSSYQLSGGDTLTIRYWSPTIAPQTLTRTVDASGSITLPDAGAIMVHGMTLGQAQALLQRRMQTLYRRAEVSVTLRELRTISVTVAGEAFLPGNFTVPSVATAYNVIYAAGGPTMEGSMRMIEVRRHGRLVGTLDLYKLMTTGDAPDIPLQSGDTIYIPGALSRVTVRGEVRREAIFETRDTEHLSDLLRFAGGVKPSGADQAIQLDTLNPGTSHVIKTISLRDASQVKQTPVYDGDEVDVFSLRLIVTNKITLEGAVEQPGDYALENGMHVADLVARARGTLPEAFLPRAELYRWLPDGTTTLIPVNLEKALAGDPAANLTLTRWDRLRVFARNDIVWTGFHKVTITGAVQKPGIYDLSRDTHLRDLLMEAGGTKPDAYTQAAWLLHQHGDGTFTYEKVRLADAVNGGGDANVLLQDNDLLAVYRVGEATFTPDHLVSVRGEVVAPGVYPRGERMKLTDLIAIAGGFKPNAGHAVILAHAHRYLDTVSSTAPTTTIIFDSAYHCPPGQDTLLSDGDVVTIQGIGGYIDHVRVVTVKGAVNKPGPIVLTNRTMHMSDALNLAGGMRPEAYPEGAEFFRDPKLLTTTSQRDLAETINRLSNLFNASEYKRALAASDIERIRAAGAAEQDSSLAGSPYAAAAAAPSMTSAALANQLSQHDLVSPPRQLKPEDLDPVGNIAVNLPLALKHPAGTDDILLEDGDTITIPEKPTTVQVVGAVVNGRGVLYKAGAHVNYYVNLAGGFAPDAARDRIVVIHAGGGLIPAAKVKELSPGDVIVVPTKVMASKLANQGASFDSIFKSVTSSLILYRVATAVFGL